MFRCINGQQIVCWLLTEKPRISGWQMWALFSDSGCFSMVANQTVLFFSPCL